MPDLSWPLDGWSLWAYSTTAHSPYLYTDVELMRAEWSTPLRCNPWTLHPLMNVLDLYWRPGRDARPIVVWQGDDNA